MKQSFLAIALAGATVAPCPGASWNDWISFTQHAAESRQVTVAAYPGFSPDLKELGQSQWGAGLALLYPVLTDHTLVGARLDWLADEFWAPSVALTLQADVQLFGHNFTPFAIGGAVMPLGGAGDQNHEVGAIVGAGIYTTVWQPTPDASVQVFFAYEHWTNLDANVYRPGIALTIRF